LIGWAWTKMPSFRIINSSHSYPLSLDLSRKARDIVKSELYQALFPNITLRKDQDTKGYFANNHGGMRYSTSTGGSVIGMHGHLINSDDPLDPNDTDSLTEAGVKEANRYQTETLPSRKVNKRTSVMCMVMQRLSPNDPTGYRLSLAHKAPVKHISLPADCREYPDVKPAKLKKFYRKGLMDPSRLSREVLDYNHAVLGNYGYAGQFGQSPVPRSGGMFDTSKLKILLVAPQGKKPIRTIRYWDKAGTQEGSGARTAGVRMSDYGLNALPRFVVSHVNLFRKNSAEREDEIEQTAEIDGREVEIWVEQEPGSGGKESAENTKRRLAGYRVRAERPTGDKIIRADPFSVQVNSGNVGLMKGDWNQEYIDEMRFYGPLGKFKDQIDASAGAFNQLFKPKLRIGAIKPKGTEERRRRKKSR
jgi:predicted phage terminase large subunit-like protein